MRAIRDNPVGRWCYKHRWGLLIFFLPVAIMYLVYSCFGVHPYGDLSVLVLDLNGQYVSYYEMMKDAIFGDHSLIYSWSRNLSGETLGIFGYYLASPFLWIVLLLPRTMMCGALEIMQLVKIGCCALAFAYYLRKSKGASNYMQLIFSVSYALMTYIVVQLMNPMWIDGMIWLPIIVLGIEELVDNGKMLKLILSLSIMFISNFYIGYMIGFFSAIYFVYYIFSRPGHAIAPHFVKAGLKFAASAVISVLTAAVVLIPVYCSLSLGKLSFSSPDFTPENQFSIFDFLTKLFPNSYDTVRPEGLPIIACGTIIIMLIPLFFMNTRIKVKEKVSLGALMFVIFGTMYLSTIDIAWHGFQVPNWLPYRYSFTFCFIMLIMAYRAFENMDGVSYKQICGTAAVWIAVLAVLNSQEHAEFYLWETVWFSILCIVVFAFLIFLYKKYRSKTMKVLVAVFVCLEIFENSMYTVWSIDCDVVYSKYSSYQDYFIDGRHVVDMVEEADDGLYRMEKTFHRTVNDPMGMGFKGISHSSSTMNTPYENPYALSIGYMASTDILDAALDSNDPMQNQEMLLQALLGDGSVKVFDRNYGYYADTVNCTTATTGDHIMYTTTVSDRDSYVEFTFTVETSDPVYVFFPTIYQRQCNMWLKAESWDIDNYAFVDYFFPGAYYSILDLGTYEPGEQLKLRMTLANGEAIFSDVLIYQLNMEEFSKAIDTLRQGEWQIEEHTDTYLSGTVTAKADQVLFTTIPYEPGWTITVDGVETEPVKVLDSLIAIPVSEGEHTVTMKFWPDYLTLGIIVSAVGVSLIVIVFIIEYKNGAIFKKILAKTK
mgnify:CR=1 FL=1